MAAPRRRQCVTVTLGDNEMGGKSTPDAPDYQGAAEAQAESSRQTIEQQTGANRPRQETPWGTVDWTKESAWDPTTEQWLNEWTQTTELNPMTQWALDNQQYLQGARSELGGDLMDRAAQEFGEEMDWSQFQDYAQAPDPSQYGELNMQGGIDTGGMTGWGQSPGSLDIQGQVDTGGMRGFQGEGEVMRELGQTPEEIRNRAESAIYDRSTSRLDPRFEQESGDLEAKLWSQGLRPGDEAYEREMDNFSRRKEDAYQTAMTESIMGGGAEGQRQYEQMLGQGQFANQATGQQYQQDMATRQAEFMEAAELRGMSNEEAQQEWASQMDQAQYQDQQRQAQFMQEAQQRGMSNEQAQAEWNARKSQEDQRYNQQFQNAEYQNTMRQAQIAEEMQRRGFSLNEINALISGQQVGMPSMPGFNTAAASEAAQYNQAADSQFNADMGAFGADQAQFQNLIGGAGTLAGMIPFGF